MAFFWPLFTKAQLYGMYGLKWSYGQILQSPLGSFAAPSGLSLVSLLPLINALLAWSVSFGGRSSLGRFVVVPYSFNFLNNRSNGAPWDVQSCRYLFITRPWSVPLHNFVPDLFQRAPWSLWCHLHGVADSGAFQNRCIYTEIMWQILWHLDCTQVDYIMWLFKVIGCNRSYSGAS